MNAVADRIQDALEAWRAAEPEHRGDAYAELQHAIDDARRRAIYCPVCGRLNCPRSKP
jgi:ferric-dicitrate binding protein FerR (iron transport regulator)